MTGTVPATFVPKMTANVAGFPMALDGSYNFDVTGTTNAFTTMFHGMGVGGIPIVPALSVHSDPQYIAAAASAAGAYAPGMVVQVPLADLPHVHGWVTSLQGWNPADIDLVIEAGGVAQHNPTMFGTYVSHTINGIVPTVHPWRSIALNSWSAPQDHGPLNRGRNVVPRRDWQMWMHAHPGVGFQLDYSDCGHLHPSLDEVPGYAMANATVSVRYAVDNEWIVIKGVATTGPHGIDMRTQYRGHAQALVGEPAFGGLAGCWGDTRIQHYSMVAPGVGAGGRPQWAAVLLNRHISLVADRLP